MPFMGTFRCLILFLRQAGNLSLQGFNLAPLCLQLAQGYHYYPFAFPPGAQSIAESHSELALIYSSIVPRHWLGRS